MDREKNEKNAIFFMVIVIRHSSYELLTCNVKRLPGEGGVPGIFVSCENSNYQRNIMKNSIALFLCGAVIFCSCKKNSSSGGGPTIDATQYYVSSVRDYSPGYLGLDSFTYNSNHYLTRYVQYSFDTTGGSPEADSLIFDFSFSGGKTVPDSYTVTDPSAGGTLHQLFYDNQNRIRQDSNTNGTMYVTNYSYPGSSLASDEAFYFFGTVDRIDTLSFSGGNNTTEKIYLPNSANTGDSLVQTMNFTYSNYGNPMYHPQISGPIGHLLFNLSFDGSQTYTDFNSKNFFKSESVVEPGYPTLTLDLNVATDNKGRVSVVTTSIYPPAFFRVVFNYY